MSFDIDIGRASERGPRDANEDFALAAQAQGADTPLGCIAALADGVSGGGGGAMAAQTTVLSVVQDYFALPPTWDATVALDRLLRAHNAWLASYNRRRGWARDAGTALTTLTALVLRGHSWTLAHVGDSRAWLLRDGELTQLTHDHALPGDVTASMLSRAVGLDEHVQVDYLQGEIQLGDTLVLTSDGVHGVLVAAALARACAAAGGAQSTAQNMADALVQAALAAGTQDNASALVLHVRGLDAGRYDDVLRAARALPAAPRLQVGSRIDDYTVTALVANTEVHRLYQAREGRTQELVAIKALHESRAGDLEERAMLGHEAWLGSRLAEHAGSGAFVRVRAPHAPSAFYVVFDWHAGTTLERLLAQRAQGTGRPLGKGVPDVVAAAIAIGRALGRMHRAGVVHRDIKPANLHLGDDGNWRILDLGAAVSGREPKALRTLHAGTPSYMNPEQWADPPAPADAGSDLFALGVTLYQWLTGHLPYGEIEPYQMARYRRDPLPPSRHAPAVPIWLDHVLLKAVARDPRQRFETAEELVLALERGASRALAAPLPTPLARRDPLALWQMALALSLLFNAMLVVWLLFLPR